MKLKASKFYLFIAFFIIYLLIPNIALAESHQIELTGIPALIAGIVMLLSMLLIFGSVPAFIIYGIFIRPNLLKKKIREYCQKNNYKYFDESVKIPINKKLYTSNVANIKHYYLIEMGKKHDISYILCHYFPRNSNSSAGYRTICVMIKEGLNIPHFVMGEYQSKQKDHFLLDNLDLDQVTFNDDEEFSERFFVNSDVPETSNFFTDNIRRVFKNIKSKNYYYEGNENVFVVSYSAPSLFEDRLKLLDFSIDLFNKLINNQ